MLPTTTTSRLRHPYSTPTSLKIYRRKVEALREALHESATRDEAFDHIRSLIETIKLVPRDGELHIEIKGELAGILELCAAGNKKPGSLSTTGLSQQIKMVAGIGFEPMTFRL